MRFPTKLVELRNSRKLTRQKLAEKVDVKADVIESWEDGTGYPTQEQLLLLATALKVKIATLVNEDRELMLEVIDATERRETFGMALVSIVTFACAAGLVAAQAWAADSVAMVSRLCEVVLVVAFLVIAFVRRGPNSMRAKAFREALEAADGSEKNFLQKVAGRNTKIVVFQFILGAVIAFALIVLLGVIMPESNLPWVSIF